MPSADTIPPALARIIDALDPATATWLRTFIGAITSAEPTLRALRIRLDVVEARLDEFLGGDEHQPLEPEPLSVIERRLEVLERAVLGAGAPTRPPARPPAPPPAPPAPVVVPTGRPTVEQADEIRFRLLDAARRGNDTFRRERDRCKRTHGLTDGAVNAIWARCQGKFRPDFTGRVLSRTAKDDRVEVRNRLAELYGVRPDAVIEWFKAWNGNGHHHPSRP
jgi:hypothetical protein